MKEGNVSIIAAVALLLSACGGGGGGGGGGDGSAGATTPASGPAPASTPTVSATSAQGRYIGTTSDNRTLTTTILANNLYYALYSRQGDPSVVNGALIGRLVTSGGTISSGDGTDYNLTSALASAINITGTYSPKMSISGTITGATATTTFVAPYDATFDVTPSLATVQGQYNGTLIVLTGTDTVSMTVDATGNLTGTGASGCTFTGTIKPDSTGYVYDVAVNFNTTGGCAYPGQGVSGIASLDSATSALQVILQGQGAFVHQVQGKTGVLILATKV
ncbi:hypothetical protein CI15_08770 [Paraburkholderia monticola]|uniref:Lipoprotein n=1 Tax=Paraburkholderia monticola TaxID=1399968 RepID=A0A149PVN3_9BURK|nr:hypothetical protein [Paraburkholderia monticola]KXU89131.1 hypothetical protein CI15_08770 [Paraburkholderia monticola]